ncbi:MAG TPA: hypothetical protein DCK81_04075, partial [Clostridiales bacterium UBA9856]|nr:hypothetical protein [Clostridiales bacterium UBA9856]
MDKCPELLPDYFSFVKKQEGSRMEIFEYGDREILRHFRAGFAKAHKNAAGFRGDTP